MVVDFDCVVSNLAVDSVEGGLWLDGAEGEFAIGASGDNGFFVKHLSRRGVLS